jgi:hypothetical protein
MCVHQVLFFVLLPKTLATLMLAYSFSYAPHKPHDTLRYTHVSWI